MAMRPNQIRRRDLLNAAGLVCAVNGPLATAALGSGDASREKPGPVWPRFPVPCVSIRWTHLFYPNAATDTPVQMIVTRALGRTCVGSQNNP